MCTRIWLLLNIMNHTTHHQITTAVEELTAERKEKLRVLVDFIKSRKRSKTNLIFICVHNSRRSHLSQVWAQIAADHYGHEYIHAYSGGTEVTAMYPKIAETFIQQGFQVETIAEGMNPVYCIKSEQNSLPIIGFSKLFDAPFNPQSDFGAVMVCSAADSNCPFISTAAQRILIPFEDPKSSDGTEEQDEVYAKRSIEIAAHFFWVFQQI